MSYASLHPTSGLPSADESRGQFSALAEPWTADLLRLEALTRADGTCTLRALGEIDLATSPLLRRHALAQLQQAPRLLVLDLRGVDFLGSSGLAVLIELRAEAKQRGIGLRLVATSRVVLRPLVATGLIKLFELDTTVELDTTDA